MARFVIRETRLYNGLSGSGARMVREGTVIGDDTDYPCDEVLGQQLVEQGFASRMVDESSARRMVEEEPDEVVDIPLSIRDEPLDADDEEESE